MSDFPCIKCVQNYTIIMTTKTSHCNYMSNGFTEYYYVQKTNNPCTKQHYTVNTYTINQLTVNQMQTAEHLII